MDPSPTPAGPCGWRHAARRAFRGRKGGAAVVFAVSGSILLGMAGLATEGTLLFLTRRDAQHGADLAALAAASAYQYRGRAAALAAATETGVRNGFAASAITVNNPPTSGSQAGNTNAFEVQINGQVPIVLSRAFASQSCGNVSERAVSLLYGTTQACIVALTGGVKIQNSSSFQALGCAVGSNAPGMSVNIPQSNSSVRAQSMIAVGTCSGCNNSRRNFTDGYQEQAAPLSNPYENLDSQPVTRTCTPDPRATAHGPLPPTGINKAYCALKFTVAGNWPSITWASGTYVFQNTPLTIGSTSSFTCNGCTFIMAGTNPQDIDLSSVSSVNLSAPATNKDDSDYDGVLIHRARGGSMGNSGPPTSTCSEHRASISRGESTRRTAT